MSSTVLQLTAVLFIGITKAGFGGGLGIAAVPLFILSMPEPAQAIGMMLPLLCFCDWFALYYYRNLFDKKNIKQLYPGVIIGIIIASLIIIVLGKVNGHYMEIMIGLLSFAFLGYQFLKTYILQSMGDYIPKPWHGWFFGSGIGITSTLAHAAGPVATMYLFPQNLGKELYTGTNVVLFTIVNISKVPFYLYLGMLDAHLLQKSLLLLPVIPVGTFLGIWMNKTVNETIFNSVIYFTLFIMSVKLTTGFDFFTFLYSKILF